MTSTRHRITAGFGWVALCNYSNRMLGFITTLVLAKVLTPADFGVVAIASMVIELLQIMKDMGLSEAVIYSKREDKKAIDTAHTILVGYNALLFILAAAAAPLAARFYDNPLILPVIVVMSANLIVNSMRSVPASLIRKNLEYSKLVLPDIVPVIVSSVVGIVMAVAGYGVWSLVAKTVLQSALALVFLELVTPYRPKFGFDRQAALELYRYGKFIIGTSMILVVLYNIDLFYVSKVSGIAAVGVFELARRIAELPVKQFSFLVGNVMFPVFSRMDRSKASLRIASLKTLKYTACITLPMAVGLSLFGPHLVAVLYGPRWADLWMPLRLLALYAAVRSLASIIHDLFKATGHPQLMQRAVTLKLIAVASLGVPALHWFGLPGISVLLVVTYALALAWEVNQLARVLEIQPVQIVAGLMRPLALSCTIIPAAYGVAYGMNGASTLFSIISGAFIGAVAYLVSMYAFDKELSTDARMALTGRTRRALYPVIPIG